MVPAPSDCSTVLLYGQKRDMNAYLARRPNAPVRTLAEIIASNRMIPGSLEYGQAIFESADTLNTSPRSLDTIRYLADRAEDLARSRGALDAVYNGRDGRRGTRDDFDAILASGNSLADTPAKAGYPSVSVPGGFVPPPDALVSPFPSNVTFTGPAFSEPTLIALGYAFEQATQHRRPPASTPALASDVMTRP
jgi:amidase